MQLQLPKSITSLPDQGDLFQDEFNQDHQRVHFLTMKLDNSDLNYIKLLANFDPFQPSNKSKHIIQSNFDLDFNEDPNIIVSTPKRLPWDLEKKYLHPLPDFSYQGNPQQIPDHDHKAKILKIFNNAPGRIVTMIRQEADQIRFIQEEVSCVSKIKIVKKIFNILIQNVLKKIKGEYKRKTLLIMLLNKVDKPRTQKLFETKNNAVAVENYKKILDEFNQSDINEAKKVLMAALYERMSANWIYYKALHMKFREGKNEKEGRECQIVMEKYLLQFRRELENCEIEEFVDREEVMKIPSSIENSGF